MRCLSTKTALSSVGKAPLFAASTPEIRTTKAYFSAAKKGTGCASSEVPPLNMKRAISDSINNVQLAKKIGKEAEKYLDEAEYQKAQALFNRAHALDPSDTTYSHLALMSELGLRGSLPTH